MSEQPTEVTGPVDTSGETYEDAVSASYAGRQAGDQLPENRLADTTRPEFNGYDAALVAYGNRTDVESLVARRIRENAPEVNDADYMRDALRRAGGLTGGTPVAEPDQTA